MTALVATQLLAPDDTVPVSTRAAAEPARKIGMQAGQVWSFTDALHAMLMSSANDAAWAIAERVGDTAEHFGEMLAEAGRQLGFGDEPVLQDPAGLDDTTSVNGGNLLSARDIAIIVRAALSVPAIASVLATPIYRFTGPDGTRHRLLNHMYRFLLSYPGALGGKPGFTSKAGYGMVMAAQRDGRTLISVVLDAPDSYDSGVALLDRGFAMAPGTGTGDVLPTIHLPVFGDPPAPAIPAGQAGPAPGHHGHAMPIGALALPAIGALGWVAIAARRRQIRQRRARRLARRRQQLERRLAA